MNDGYVLFSRIVPNVDGIFCNTNRNDCCRHSDNPSGGAQGHWYRPNGDEVGSYTMELANNPRGQFFYRNRESGVVRLYRNGDPLERGRFHCVIPNANGVNEIRYVNIGECFHILMAHGHWKSLLI